MGTQAGDRGPGFRLDRRRQDFVIQRNVEIGEHEVMPHHDAKLVASLVEGLGLVRHCAADAHHVGARVAEPHECGAHIGLRARSPACPSSKNRHPVDSEAKASVGGVDFDVSKPNPRLMHHRPIDDKFEYRQSRRAVGMGPPASRLGHSNPTLHQGSAAGLSDLDRVLRTVNAD